MTSFKDLCSNILPSQTKIDDFAKSVVSCLQMTETSEQPCTFRASSMPICGRKFSFSQVLKPEDKQATVSDFVLSLQSSIGTAMHSTVQRWLGKFGILFGDWSCPKCHREKLKHLGTPICKKCDLEMVYKELDLKHQTVGVTGHPDGILRVGSKWVGFELKTKSQRTVDEISKPIETHVRFQTACYAVLLEMVFGIKLDEYAIFYISRDTPWSHRVGYSRSEGAPIETIYSRGRSQQFLLKIFRLKVDTTAVSSEFSYIKKVIKAQIKHKKKLLPRDPWGICKSSTDPGAKFCKYKFLCFGRLATKLETSA